MTLNIGPNNTPNIATDAQNRSTSPQPRGADGTESSKTGAFSQILDKTQQVSSRKQGAESGPNPTIASNIANETENRADTAGKLPPEWFIARTASNGNEEKQPTRGEPETPEGKDGKDSQAAGGESPNPNALMMAIHTTGTGKTAGSRSDSSAGTGSGDGAKSLASQRAAIGMDDLAAQQENGKSAAGKSGGQPGFMSRQDGPRVFPSQSTFASADTALPRPDSAMADASPNLQLRGAAGAPTAKPDEEPSRSLPIGPQATKERVSVVASQSIPAPVHHQIGQTALSLVGAIAGDTNWQTMLPTPGTAAFTTQSGLGPAHMLKIELHPADLGMVQVGLRLAGGQLSIEITPQTHEAYRHLASDTDAIARSMRDLGFDVGKITLLQPTLAAVALPRLDAGGGLASAGRDQSFQQQGQAGSGGSNGQQSGQSRGQEQGRSHRSWAPDGGHAGRGLVI